MAKHLICDKCGTETNQSSFDHFTIYRSDAQDRVEDHFDLDLCGQCGVEFRELYRFAWLPKGKDHAQAS